MSNVSVLIGSNTAELQSFFNSMEYYLSVSKAVKQRLDKELASSFSVFDYVSDNETMLSRILADLLNNNGSHGQGDLFMREFLDIFQILPIKPMGEPVVSLEYPTRRINSFNRRIDIHLSWDNFGIGIENKPWASEQDDQLKDYNEHLEKEFNGNYILVFLSPAGRTPKSITRWEELTKKGKAAAISFYPDIHDWLIRCRQQCEAEKVRHFIKDFADYIQYNLNGDFTVQESNNV